MRQASPIGNNLTQPNHQHLQNASVIFRKPQAQFFSTVVDQGRSKFQDRTYSTLTKSQFETADDAENKRLLHDLKFTVHQRKIEELEQVSCQ